MDVECEFPSPDDEFLEVDQISKESRGEIKGIVGRGNQPGSQFGRSIRRA